MVRKKLIIMAFLFIIGFVLFASSSEAMPWESGLQKVADGFGGTTAKIIGVLLIVGGGIAVAVTEGQAIKKLLWVVVGMGIALNAVSFMAMLFGNTTAYLLM